LAQQSRDLRRSRGTGRQRVTNSELFFDLVYVFAVTQLSHYLHEHATLAGALEAALLLAMVWLAWAYTAWVTNWLDPEQIPVRLMLLALMLVGLAMWAALPFAFGKAGWIVGCGYAVMQVGRSAFAVWALRGQALRLNFERILVWCCVSGALAVAGGLVTVAAPRALFWLAAVGTDVLGGAARFYVPGLGQSTTLEWDIEGGHFAERCQGFVLIALGESIVVIGGTLAGLLASRHALGAGTVAAFLVAFVDSVALWWLYFDRSAEESAQLIAESADPGRLGRSAYHDIHPIMVAGIIVVAAADYTVLASPGATGGAFTSWLILGGTGLFIAGHLAFKFVVWHQLSWPRAGALVVLGLLGLAAGHVSALALSACATATVLAIAVADYLRRAAVSTSAPGSSAPGPKGG
jgi:low temperature requirement protein LtrA